MSFCINLAKYEKKYTFPKDKFTSYFSRSMITQALEHDPDVEEININHNDVIPEAMDILHMFVNGDGDIPYNVKDPESVVKSGKYLLIDLLVIVAHPKWSDFSQKFYPLILVKPHRILHIYEHIIRVGDKLEFYPLIEYIFELIPSDSSSHEDLTILLRAIIKNDMVLVKHYLKRVDPSLSVSDDIVLEKSKYISQEQWKKFKSNHIIKLAIFHHNNDIIEMLLKDGRIKDDDGSILDIVANKFFTNHSLPLILTYITYPIESITNVISKLSKMNSFYSVFPD